MQVLLLHFQRAKFDNKGADQTAMTAQMPMLVCTYLHTTKSCSLSTQSILIKDQIPKVEELIYCLHAGLFCMLFLSYADFFFKSTFSKKKIQEYHQRVKQMDLICVQTVSKGYQQTTLVGKDLTRHHSL